METGPALKYPHSFFTIRGLDIGIPPQNIRILYPPTAGSGGKDLPPNNILDNQRFMDDYLGSGKIPIKNRGASRYIRNPELLHQIQIRMAQIIKNTPPAHHLPNEILPTLRMPTILVRNPLCHR